ncbi:hypothetical protein Tco_0155436 [Tanacetum coccineum]
MEMEAVKQEQLSLENQSVSLQKHISISSTEVDALKNKRNNFLEEVEVTDFTSCDPHVARDQYEKLQAEQSSLEKRVNKKVMAMCEKAEDEYNDLISKKNIIEFKLVIEELNEKKKETLKVTWVEANGFVSLKEGMFDNANVLFRQVCGWRLHCAQNEVENQKSNVFVYVKV